MIYILIMLINFEIQEIIAQKQMQLMIPHPDNTIKQNTFTCLNNSSSIEILF